MNLVLLIHTRIGGFVFGNEAVGRYLINDLPEVLLVNTGKIVGHNVSDRLG